MKLGMVFEGGASRTIFSCGVADAFLEENIMPDYFIGVSAGIAFGLSYLSKAIPADSLWLILFVKAARQKLRACKKIYVRW